MAQENRFAELLSAVAREVTLRQASDVCCGDLTLEQFQTLSALSASDELSIGALSTQLRVDMSTMSRNVTVLERNGYLLRARSAEDARVVHVRLTAKGKRALESLRCDERDVLKDVYQRLPTAERPFILKALQALQSCLGESAGGAPCCPPARPGKSAS
jgi:DNA-binding MarR family transcriptional regulator